MGLILGLDLGVSSVGFGIIQEDSYEIIDYGVRLFEEGAAEKNLKRRTMRGARRLKARKRNRINALKYFLIELGIIESKDFQVLNHVYELRVKGLTSKLSSLELANVLVNLAKHRGVSFDIICDDQDKDAQTSYQALTDNTKLLRNKNKYICELQLEKLERGEKLRSIDNLYHTKDYENEIRKILSNQDLREDAKEKIINIILRKRDFSEGPGSEKFPTPYGSYRIIENEVKKVNLIDEMRGKCSIFPDEPRIAKNTYKACLFNFLNDLNNLTIIRNGEKIKLKEEEKLEIIKIVDAKGHITPNQLIKFLEIDMDSISGFRIDKKSKPLLTTFDIYEKIIKLKLDYNLIEHKNEVNSIIEVLTKTIVKEKRVEEIKNLKLNLTDNDIDKLASLSKVNGYHSLSEKAMDILIPELLSTSTNQMEIINKNNLIQNKLNFKGTTIPFDDTAILSPVALRVHRQALEVINELRKKYGEFSAIIIETTRAKNSAEEKKEEKEKQKRFEDNNKKVDDFIRDLGREPEKINVTGRFKLMLYKEQEGKTIYSGEPIDLDRLFNDPIAYQIEHIIPYSISFDNSLNNKALASYKENQDKGNCTPWAYFSSGKVKGPNQTWEDYEAFINSLPNLNMNKRKNLLNQEDITKYETRKEFINRNLNDTSYGIRTVMNTLKAYFKQNSISTNVFTIKGKVTSAFRNKVRLKKDRDIYIHHAIDALIIAGFKNQKTFYHAFNLDTDENLVFDSRTGEMLDLSDPLEDRKLLSFIENLRKITGKPQDFSYKVDTKTNRQFSDETIYSTRIYDDGEYVIMKYKDIYGKEGEALKKKFIEGKADVLLAFRNDRPTYDLLNKIVESYPYEKNPFAKYKEEHGYIRKYSKNGNGPMIKQLKYRDCKLGNHCDITHKYKSTKNKKVILLQNTPYRTDFYIDKEGKYKFLTIRRYHVKQKNGYNIIDSTEYKKLMDYKNISVEDKFLFSMNRNNIIRVISENDEYYRFIATNNDKTSTIEVKRIECLTEKQMMISISKKIKKLEKYNVSPTGKYAKVEKETLKLKW